MRIVDALIVTMILIITSIISYFVSLAILGPVGYKLGETLGGELSGQPASLITRIISTGFIALGTWIVLAIVAIVVYFYLEATRRESVTGLYGGVRE